MIETIIFRNNYEVSYLFLKLSVSINVCCFRMEAMSRIITINANSWTLPVIAQQNVGIIKNIIIIMLIFFLVQETLTFKVLLIDINGLQQCKADPQILRRGSDLSITE